MAKKIKKCPFCGDVPKVEFDVRVRGDAQLSCCVSMYEDKRSAGASEAVVVARWNVRSGP